MKISYKELKSLIREAMKGDDEKHEFPNVPPYGDNRQPAGACQKCGKEHDLETSCLEAAVLESVGLGELDSINEEDEKDGKTCEYCDKPTKKCYCFGAKKEK